MSRSPALCPFCDRVCLHPDSGHGLRRSHEPESKPERERQQQRRPGRQWLWWYRQPQQWLRVRRAISTFFLQRRRVPAVRSCRHAVVWRAARGDPSRADDRWRKWAQPRRPARCSASPCPRILDGFDFFDVSRTPDVQVPGVGTIRGYNFRDGGRGVNLEAGQNNRKDDQNDFATVFPAPAVRAASWGPRARKTCRRGHR